MRRVRARRLLATLGVAAAGLAARSVLAHHSPARYDLQAQRTVEGTIADYEWGNPHVYLSVRENGSDRVWIVEAYPSTAMKQYGWAADTFLRGESVVVGGSPGRDASRNILFLKMIRKAGSAVALYDSGGAEAALPNKPGEIFRATSVAGTWMSSVGPLFGTFFGPGVMQISTPQGAAAVAEFNDSANPGLQCVPFQPPVYMSQLRRLGTGETSRLGGFAPLFALFLLLFTGPYMFVLPHAATWRPTPLFHLGMAAM